ncbi:MAG: signal recognition particle-docking protein FtsY [Alphaproteobacteria bacterium]|nr:signal recognition particle-docking protein FtsY [Alphaproteobacteria bacterium]
MAGFFKKLFNRITGRPTGEAAPEAAEQAALPAPELEQETAPAPEPVAEVVAEPASSLAEPVQSKKAKPAAPGKPETKKQPAKKPEAPKPAAKKAEDKKPQAKKAEALKPQPKKAEPKKLEPEKPVTTAKAKPAAPAPKPIAEAPLPEAPPPPLPETPVTPVAPPPVAVVSEPEPQPAPPSAKAIAPPAETTESPQRSGWLSRLREGLSKTSKSVAGNITAIFTKKKLDKATLQDLEDTLIQADLGLPVAERIIAAVSHGRYDKEIDPEEVKQILASEVAKVLKPVEVPFNFGEEKPFVILVCGVNGAGKTTTIGKLGAIAAREGYKVMFAACDTFRAAAIEQLTVWGQRIGAKTISRPTGADSAGLAFDALKEARENGTDILFIDTAGRLQNKAYLMDELDKLVRVIKKLDATAPHAVLLVLDATTGQNALAQAEIFTKVAGVTGLIMTKLDGTARGGILVAIAEKYKLPIHAVGVGESIDDLQPFDADGFARAIAGLEDA